MLGSSITVKSFFNIYICSLEKISRSPLKSNKLVEIHQALSLHIYIRIYLYLRVRARVTPARKYSVKSFGK